MTLIKKTRFDGQSVPVEQLTGQCARSRPFHLETLPCAHALLPDSVLFFLLLRLGRNEQPAKPTPKPSTL